MEGFQNTLPSVKSKVRFLHAVPLAGNIDIYANNTLMASNVSFGKISDYKSLSSDQYKIEIYNTGTHDVPIYSEDIQFTPNVSYTLSLNTLADSFYLFKLKDDSISTSNTNSLLRFINLSRNAPLLSLSLPTGEILFNSVEYLETTGYYHLSSGIYNLEVSIGSASNASKFIKNLTLDGNKFYTIYIIGLFNDKPPLGYLFLEDS